jgi:hypothetical protein
MATLFTYNAKKLSSKVKLQSLFKLNLPWFINDTLLQQLSLHKMGTNLTLYKNESL